MNTRSLSSRPEHVFTVSWSISHCSHVLGSSKSQLIHSNCRSPLHGTSHVPPTLTQGDFLPTQPESHQQLWNHPADWISPHHSRQGQSFYVEIIFITWSETDLWISCRQWEHTAQHNKGRKKTSRRASFKNHSLRKLHWEENQGNTFPRTVNSTPNAMGKANLKNN